jgi:Tfp pilus assembly protein PilO
MNVTLFRSSKTNRAAVHVGGAALMAVVAAVFYQGFYAPLRDEVTERRQRLDEVRDLASHRPEIAAQHNRTTKRLEQLTSAARATRGRMPSTIAASDFVDKITQLAGEHDLDIDQAATNPPQFHQRHATIDVSCQVTGSYASICNYLAAVDQLPQISRVWSFDLERKPQSDVYPSQVIFQLYYQLIPNDKDYRRGTL